MTDARRNWFDGGGAAYAAFRPDYPAALAAHLAGLAAHRQLALDVGCGSGQFTRQLADHFDRVVGIDPSSGQLQHAPALANITYLCAPAESIALPDGSVDLVTAAQAAHWFDLDRFYAEARRVARKGAVLALISYSTPSLPQGPLQDRLYRFYWDEIGPFWPPERRLVDSGYVDIAFPFAPLPAPSLTIRRDWALEDFLGYISTWSAVRRAVESGASAIPERFGRDIAALWGDPTSCHAVQWPVTLRAGRLG
jgi:SAM-dependent methyltransferase